MSSGAHLLLHVALAFMAAPSFATSRASKALSRDDSWLFLPTRHFSLTIPLTDHTSHQSPMHQSLLTIPLTLLPRVCYGKFVTEILFP